MSSGQPAQCTTRDSKGVKRAPEQQEQNIEDIRPPPSKISKQNPDDEDSSKLDSSLNSVHSEESEVAVKAGKVPTDSERVEAEALSSLGLTVEERLEVMWLLEDDESSVEKVRA